MLGSRGLLVSEARSLFALFTLLLCFMAHPGGPMEGLLCEKQSVSTRLQLRQKCSFDITTKLVGNTLDLTLLLCMDCSANKGWRFQA